LDGIKPPISATEVAKAADEYQNACNVDDISEEELLRLSEKFGIEVSIVEAHKIRL
jgi:formylmethanofuran dehydrogenase subunit D